MKRRVEQTTKVEGVTPTLHTQRAPHTATSVVQTSYPNLSKAPSTDVGGIQQYPIQSNYVTMPSISTSLKSISGGGLQGGGPHSGILLQSQFRHNKPVLLKWDERNEPYDPGSEVQSSGGGTTPPTVGTGSSGAGAGGGGGGTQQFQRLKVEDALSYLDQVKYKFNSQPQVYNDFLEIMKEFKSQCIDTPGVITRVSHLFKGYPELISGFNTFLPPGYKIEVQANDTGYSLQVSVSNPLGHHTMTEIPPLTPTQPQSVVVANQTSKPPQTVYTAGGGSVVVTTSGGPVHHVKTSCTPNERNSVPPGALALTSGGPQERSATSLGIASNQGPQSQAEVNTPGALSVAAVAAATGVPIGNHQAAQQATNQPVEFNHAINYVNKIKNRFQGQPDKYKKFLEILHTYQKEQKNVKSGSGGGGGGGGGKHLTEAEVYSQVAQLFENHDDLLVEFGQFLPDATSHNSFSLASLVSTSNHHPGAKLNDRKSSLNVKYSSGSGSRGEGGGRDRGEREGREATTKSSPPGSGGPKTLGGSKRSVSGDVYGPVGAGPHSPGPVHHGPSVPMKRQKLVHHPTSATIPGFTYFDSIKRVLRNQSAYENFLRCIHLYNQDIISKAELVVLVTPVLSRYPDQLNWLKEFLGETGPIVTDTGRGSAPVSPPGLASHPLHHPLHIPGTPSINSSIAAMDHQPSSVRNDSARPDLLTTASTADIDFSTCKRIGASYCALPKNAPPPKCSGRTPLCRQVLNDVWVSFPTWSEDSTFVTSRKTQYEEYIYRCEDERFELDLVIECNAATIRVLEGVLKKMSRMSPEELAKFRLDDTLGGTSPTIHLRAIKRMYGDKAGDVIEGLKKNPSVAVPLVLRRLKAKEVEWRQAQKGFNKTWRDQNEKFYLKSLDHQGINFKQNDLKALRSKSLYSEIETAYDDRNEAGDEPKSGAHLSLPYPDKTILDDAANLLIHHVKRQTAIHKEDKQRIKQLLRHSIPDMFHHTRQDLSDDERECDDKMDVDSTTNKENNGTVGNNIPNNNNNNNNSSNNNNNSSSKKDEPSSSPAHLREDICFKPSPNPASGMPESPHADAKPEIHPTKYPDDVYTLFFANNNWYLFLRLHQILCDRLAKMAERSLKIAEEEAINSLNRKESTAVALRLKPNEHCQDCYATMLDMVKSVLDCSLEPQTYEDLLRNMFGIHAYVGFTLDRIVTYAVRQLQQLVTDDGCVECWDLHTRFRSKGGAGGPVANSAERAAAEAAYMRAVSALIGGDNCYKIHIYKKECKGTIELLDSENDCEEEEVRGSGESKSKPANGPSSTTSKWSEYSHIASSVSEKADSGVCLNDRERWSKAVYLHRNLSKLRDFKIDGSNGGNKSNKRETYLRNKCLGSGSDAKVYYILQDSLLYMKGCFMKARKTHCRLTRRLNSRFEAWHSSWARREVSDEAREATSRWFMGDFPDALPNSTEAVSIDPKDAHPPYRPYCRYRVRLPP